LDLKNKCDEKFKLYREAVEDTYQLCHPHGLVVRTFHEAFLKTWHHPQQLAKHAIFPSAPASK
jgi:hypothetical protein